MKLSTIFVAALAAAPSAWSKSWHLSESLKGNQLISFFNFENKQADNGGVAYYNSVHQAKSKKLVSTSRSGAVTIRVGTQQRVKLRDSVRMVSKQTFNANPGHLFIFDVAHMPSGCGVWPAIWATGSHWPTQGELDLVENVHDSGFNTMSTHTGNGCVQQSNGFTGKFMMQGANKNQCSVYKTNGQGCGVMDTRKNTFGPGFNKARGGYFALQLDGSGVRSWYFPRSRAPADIKSSHPRPEHWGTPANFVHPSSCNTHKYFKDLMLVINTNLGGTWPAGTWNSDLTYAGGPSASCAKRTGFRTAEQYVKQMGGKFHDAYWTINSIKIFH